MTSNTELEELRRRVAALEGARASDARVESEKPPTTAPPATDLGPVNLEKKTHARAVPVGLKIGGYMHAQFERNQLSEDQLIQGGEPLNQDRFLVRRARFRLDRGWDYAAATLELDANTVREVTVGIRRAEASLVYRRSRDPNATPLMALTLGVTDLPFGFELAESARVRPFMERSLGSQSLFPTEADAGLKLWGAASFLRYGLMVSNGEPLDTQGFPRDPNAAKDITGRVGVDVKPIPLLSVSGGTSFATGRGFHAGEHATKDSLVWTDLDSDGRVTPDELLGVPGSAASPSENFSRWALGVDLELAFHTAVGDSKLYAEAFVASNYDRGLIGADPIAAGGIDIRHTGVYAALVQDVTEYGLVGFRWAFYDPDSDVLEQRVGQVVPLEQSIVTLSPLVGLVLEDRARLLFQYDFVRDHLARDARGVPADAENDALTLRLQVEL